MLEFGESVHFIPVSDYKAVPKAEARGKIGVWIGVDDETDEHLIGTTDGVYVSRTVRRRPADVRWDPALIKSMKGLPWQPYPQSTDDTLKSFSASALRAGPCGWRSPASSDAAKTSA